MSTRVLAVSSLGFSLACAALPTLPAPRAHAPAPALSDFLHPSGPDWPRFGRASCTPAQSPGWGLRRPGRSRCQGCPAGRHIRAIPARRLPLHVEGRVRHLLSMKCGFRDILWKQKRKNHRGPSCKNNHYPLQRALRNFRAESTSLLMTRNSDRNPGRARLLEGRNGMFVLAQWSGGERRGAGRTEQRYRPRLCNPTPASSPCFVPDSRMWACGATELGTNTGTQPRARFSKGCWTCHLP